MVFAISQSTQPETGKQETGTPIQLEGADPADQHTAWLYAQARGRQRDPYRYLLALRFALVNVLAFGLLGVAYSQGLVEKVIASDQTFLCVLIFGVFCIGLALCGWKVWQTSRDLNSVRRFDPLSASRATEYLIQLRGRDGSSRSLIAAAMRMKLSHRITVIRHIANSLVLLGLIGTVVGFIIALSGVDPEQAADVKAVAPMISTLIEGMSTALYTTLVGAVLNVWLMANHQILAGGTVKLITGLVEFGEEHARA